MGSSSFSSSAAITRFASPELIGRAPSTSRIRPSWFSRTTACRSQGGFRAQIDDKAGEIRWELTFGDLESNATQSHIHFENRTNSGPVVVFLCTNLGNSPVPVQACPAGGGTISGTIKAADVIGVAGGAAVGIADGDFDDLVRAIRAGAAYVNVHSTTRPAGEVRAQLGGK